MPTSTESFTARFGRAALFLLAFGILELIAGGFLTHSPALVADAGHNLADSGMVVLFMGIEVIASRASSHMLSCTSRRIAGIAALAITIVLIAWFVYAEAGQSQSELGPWLVVILGLAGFGLNYWLSRGLKSQTNANAQSNSNHLFVDAFISLTLVASAPVAYLADQSWPYVASAVVILVVVAIHNGIEIWELAQTIHRAENHAEGDEHLDSHEHGHAH